MATDNKLKVLTKERSVIQRARDGELSAFDRLFTEHKDGVYACLWHLLGADPDQVEEAVGAVFLSAFRGLRGFRGDSAFSTWLYRIAINEAHARIKQKRRSRLFGWLSLNEPKLPEAKHPRACDPAEQFISTETKELLWKSVQALPEPYRTPTVLRYM